MPFRSFLTKSSSSSTTPPPPPPPPSFRQASSAAHLPSPTAAVSSLPARATSESAVGRRFQNKNNINKITHGDNGLLARRSNNSSATPQDETTNYKQYFYNNGKDDFAMNRFNGGGGSNHSRSGNSKMIVSSTTTITSSSHMQHQQQQSSSVWRLLCLGLVLVSCMLHVYTLIAIGLASSSTPLSLPPLSHALAVDGIPEPPCPTTATSMSSSLRGDAAAAAAAAPVISNNNNNVAFYHADSPLAASSKLLAHHNHNEPPPQQERASLDDNYQDYTERVAVIAKKNITVRYSTRRYAEFEDSSNNDEQILVGVLTVPKNREHRQIIRQLWARGHSGVFFIVGGNWTDELAEEFVQYGDMIWMDRKESYRGLVWKTLALFAAFEPLHNYRHILKTDDDSYVRLGSLEVLSAGNFSESDYWGNCKQGATVYRDPEHKWYVSPSQYAEKTFPPYALGGGYMISQSFARCAVEMARNRTTFPIEDAYVGTLAKACNVKTCDDVPGRLFKASTHESKFSVKSRSGILKHKVSPLEMIGFHHLTCTQERYAQYETKSCGDRSLLVQNGEAGYTLQAAFPAILTD